MGYDVDLMQISVPAKTAFPVAGAKATDLLSKAVAFDDPDAVRQALLKIEGCKPGPEDAVDFLGRGLNYARFWVKADRIHVDNNCGPGELLKICRALRKQFGDLLIFDLQTKELHDADSLAAWWAKPL